MSGKRAKNRVFPYIKQNSIAEIRSTMEFFCASAEYKAIMKEFSENSFTTVDSKSASSDFSA
jgi:hypothetical protein